MRLVLKATGGESAGWSVGQPQDVGVSRSLRSVVDSDQPEPHLGLTRPESCTPRLSLLPVPVSTYRRRLHHGLNFQCPHNCQVGRGYVRHQNLDLLIICAPVRAPPQVALGCSFNLTGRSENGWPPPELLISTCDDRRAILLLPTFRNEYTC